AFCLQQAASAILTSFQVGAGGRGARVVGATTLTVLWNFLLVGVFRTFSSLLNRRSSGSPIPSVQRFVALKRAILNVSSMISASLKYCLSAATSLLPTSCGSRVSFRV